MTRHAPPTSTPSTQALADLASAQAGEAAVETDWLAVHVRAEWAEAQAEFATGSPVDANTGPALDGEAFTLAVLAKLPARQAGAGPAAAEAVAGPAAPNQAVHPASAALPPSTRAASAGLNQQAHVRAHATSNVAPASHHTGGASASSVRLLLALALAGAGLMLGWICSIAWPGTDELLAGAASPAGPAPDVAAYLCAEAVCLGLLLWWTHSLVGGWVGGLLGGLVAEERLPRERLLTAVLRA